MIVLKKNFLVGTIHQNTIIQNSLYILTGVGILKTQMQALAKLQPTDSTVISTWPITKISESVGSIHNQLQNEYRLKFVITGKP